MRRKEIGTMTQATVHQPTPALRNLRSIKAYAPAVGRVLLGLVFFTFGLNGFLQFLPAPSPPPEAAMAFAGALMKTGYMFPLIKGTEVLVGALLLSNRFVPLALALIAPVVVNIVAFHLALAPSGIALASVVLVLELFLAWSYRNAYRPMLAARTSPR
jgi:uncharacterized membrane protein YphA (DoxX/SURF4 family)